MKLFHNSLNLEFEVIALKMIKNDLDNVFSSKNNKTVLETLNHEKYLKLRKGVLETYGGLKNERLGDFLCELKSRNDRNYLLFLNKYGDSNFCEFKIFDNLNEKGIYCFIVGDEVKYIGRCVDNFKNRINNGYGKIHPKNCYIDGQATNCHVNSLINKSVDVKVGIYKMTGSNDKEIKDLEKKILSLGKFEWNVQKS